MALRSKSSAKRHRCACRCAVEEVWRKLQEVVTRTDCLKRCSTWCQSQSRLNSLVAQTDASQSRRETGSQGIQRNRSPKPVKGRSRHATAAANRILTSRWKRAWRHWRRRMVRPKPRAPGEGDGKGATTQTAGQIRTHGQQHDRRRSAPFHPRLCTARPATTVAARVRAAEHRLDHGNLVSAECV